MGRFREEFVDSMHLKPDDFVRRLDFKEEEGILLTPWPKQGEFGKNCLSIDSCIRCDAVVGSNLRNSSQLVQPTGTEGRRIESQFFF